MDDGKARRPAPGTSALPIAAACAVLVLLIGGYFATLQNVWIDESTQLLGSRLPLPRLIRWLAGGYEPLGVPADRMPPGSYLVDWLCGRTLCGAPFDYRLLHLAAMATGVALVAWLAARRHGLAAGLVAGLVLALLPQTAFVGVEVRAYPFFFLATAVQLVLLYRLFDTEMLSAGRVAAFAAVGLVAVYTHFFGLVSSSALFVGLVVARARSRRDLLLIGAAWGVLLLLSAGLAPFIGGARAISTTPEVTATDPRAIAVYLLRIVGNAPMLLAPAFAALFFAGFAMLLAIAGVATVRAALSGERSRMLDAPAAVIVAVVAGLAVSILAAFVVAGFNPMKPSYSIWLLPPLALLAGVAAARGIVGIAVATVTLAALLGVTGGFVRQAELFVHGPERAVAEEIGADPRATAVVYVGPEWGYAYFPLVYRYGGALAHYRRDARGMLARIGPGGATGAAIPGTGLDRYRRLLLVEVATRTGGDLRAAIAGAADPALSAPLSPDAVIPMSSRWSTADAIVRPGLYWLRLTRLEKAP